MNQTPDYYQCISTLIIIGLNDLSTEEQNSPLDHLLPKDNM